MIKEHDRVALTVAVPKKGLEPGDVGTVVHMCRDGRAYEVECFTPDGHTAAVVMLEGSKVRRGPAVDSENAITLRRQSRTPSALSAPVGGTGGRALSLTRARSSSTLPKPEPDA